MNDIAIRVENLSKCYQIYDKPHQRLLQGFLGSKKQYYKEFWALKDVSFEIKKGETIGIIGRNGSGKSTLLQLICGTLTPTHGTVETFGRIGALLELGAGFNPEFTGRENVYMNASILGLSHDEIDMRFDEIAAFADIGEFIEQPVKSYSSGMLVRLAFAVQVVIEPEILIVDEALSVGDFFFQQKCFAQLREMQQKGITLLFVSHDMGVVRNTCSRISYLMKGQQKFNGEADRGISMYQNENSYRSDTTSSKNPNLITIEQAFLIQDKEPKLLTPLWTRPKNELVEKITRITAIGIYDEFGSPCNSIKMGQKIILSVLYQAFTQESVHVGVIVKNKYDLTVNVTTSYTLGMQPPTISLGGYAIINFEMICNLESGEYGFNFNLGIENSCINQGTNLDETPWLGPIKIYWDYENEKAPFFGMFGLPVNASFDVFENRNE